MGGFGGILGGIAGGVVGFFIGGPLGASIGFAAGSMVGNLLDPPKVEVPEPQMQKAQLSEYGRPIPILFGVDRFAGTVIWQKYPFDKHKQKSGGKGTSPEVTTTTFSTSFAVQICEGPIDHIRQVFADGRLVWEGEDTDTFSFTFYPGDEEQLPDPTMEAELGVGEVPGHRGYCYVVFTDLMLKDFGERIPQLEFVVSSVPEQAIPIERIAQNYDMPVAPLQPAITKWTRSGQIRVTETYLDAGSFTLLRSPKTTPYQVQAYDSSLVHEGIDLEMESDHRPIHFILCNEPPDAQGRLFHYIGVGMYRYDADDSALLLPLWVRTTDALSVGPTFGISSGDEWPMLISSDAFSFKVGGDPNENIPKGTEYGTEFGLAAGLFIRGASLSADQRELYLFTAPDAASDIDTWYEIINGEIARQGTVSPTLDKDSIGYGNSAAPALGLTGSNSFENQGQYMWLYASNTGAGGSVSIYEIDDSLNFALNSFFGTEEAGGPAGASTQGSIQVLRNGYAGIVRGDGRLAIFRRVIPNDGVRLGDIISALSAKTPLEDDEVDTTDQNQRVTGFRVTSQMEVANALQPLRQAYFVDATERDGVIVFVNRGADPVDTFDSDDLAARPGGDAAPAVLQTVRAPEWEAPRRVFVDFLDLDKDFQKGSTYDERQVTESLTDTTVSLPLVLRPNTAKQIAKALLWEGHEGRQGFTWWTSRKYLKYEPTDVVTVDGKAIRIDSKKELANGVIEWQGVLSRQLLFLPGADSEVGQGVSTAPPQSPPQDKALTHLVLLDIPILAQADYPFGFYAAMCPAGPGPWGGATLHKSVDGGETWVQIASTTTADVIGTVAEALEATTSSSVDVLTVTLVDAEGELASCTDEALANGANMFALQAGTGWELCQFQTATLIESTPNKRYEITVDVRGIKGSAGYMDDHAAGDTFVLLPCVNVDAPQIELNQALLYKAVTNGATLSSAAEHTFTNTGESAGGSNGGGGGGGVEEPGHGHFDVIASNFPITRKVVIAGTYTLQAAERAFLLQFDNATGVTVTLPDDLPRKWWTFIENIGAGDVTLTPAGAAQIDNNGGDDLTVATDQGLLLVFDGVDYGTERGMGSGGVGGAALDVQLDGVSIEDPVDTINFVDDFAVTTPGAGAVDVELGATGVVAGVYGDGNTAVTLTVDAKGRLTSISNTDIVGHIEVQEEGSTLNAAALLLNFIGSGVTAVNDGSSGIDITIPGGTTGINITVKNTNYTFVIGDAGGGFLHEVGDANPRVWTIPANGSVAFPIGTTLTFINEGATTNYVTISITTDTLVLGGTTNTGSRILQQNGVATALKVATTRWIINGTALA